MKPVSFLILLFQLSFISAYSQAIDTVQIRQFSYTTYEAGSVTYFGTEGPDGQLFIGNSEGLLIYDGTDWELIRIDDNSSIQAVQVDNERVYVGGYNEIGFVDKDNLDNWHYHSLTSLVDSTKVFNDIWQVVKNNNDIYFVSYEMILIYDGNSIKEMPIENSYVYLINNNIIASSFDGILRRIGSDSILETLNTPTLYGDAAFAILPYDNNGEYLYFTAESGVLKLQLNPMRMEVWNTPMSDILRDAGVYSAVYFSDDIIVCTTWREGVMLFKKDGSFIRKIDFKSGLPNLELRDLFVDSNKNIWVTSNSGVYQMRFSLNPTVSEFVPKTYLRSLITSSGNRYNIANLTSIYDPESIIFSYTTPGINSEYLEYSFFLEGQDKEWSSYTKQYTKEYSNLNHGSYTFKVKSRVIGSSVESVPGELFFSITLPWYKRQSVYIITLAIFIISIYLFLRIRNRRMIIDKKRLEKRVNERTRELSLEREKLQKLNEELQLANSELDHFVYRSSHDLVAPLKSLQGLMTVAKMDTKDTEMHKYLDLMETSAIKLETFIGSIMEYSVNSKSSIDLEDVNLENLVNQILDEIKYFDKFEAIDFILEIDSPIIQSDVKRMKIILNNLITNSIKYHDLNKTNPWIKIKSTEVDKNVVLQVIDNGQGIEEEHLEEVFSMFYRASINSEGSGLGLYIVKDTVEKINGVINIESTVEEGTTVTIKLSVDD